MNKNILSSYALLEEPKMDIEETKAVINSKKVLEKVLLEYRIRLNKELYEEESISYDVYQNMENYLIKKIKNI